MPSPAVIEPFPLAGAAPSAALLEAVALGCIRGDAVLFSDLSFALAPGEVLHISGPNGSGKTSLLRMLCGLGLPEQGEVRWHGADIQLEFADFMWLRNGLIVRDEVVFDTASLLADLGAQ